MSHYYYQNYSVITFFILFLFEKKKILYKISILIWKITRVFLIAIIVIQVTKSDPAI